MNSMDQQESDLSAIKLRKKKRKWVPEIYYPYDHVAVIGDSMLQHVGHIRNTIVRAYRDDTIENIKNHVAAGYCNEEIINKSAIILHVGTNDLYTRTIPQMIQDLVDLIEAIRYWNKEGVICYSGIIARPRDFNTTQIKAVCFNGEVKFWS